MLVRLVSLSVCGLAVLCCVVGSGVEPTCSIANGKTLEKIRGGSICADGPSLVSCPVPAGTTCEATICILTNNGRQCKQIMLPVTNPPMYMPVLRSYLEKTDYSNACTVGAVGQSGCMSFPEPCIKVYQCADACVVDMVTGNHLCQKGGNWVGLPDPNFLPAGPSCNSTSFPIASQRPADRWIIHVAANNGLWHRVFEIN